MNLKVGDLINFERAFTIEDIERFTQVSRDEGAHHIHPDEDGRLVVQGLLTATLPTKVGGDHNVLARTMNFEFLRPVFTGDTIRCEVTIEKLEKQADHPHSNRSIRALGEFWGKHPPTPASSRGLGCGLRFFTRCGDAAACLFRAAGWRACLFRLAPARHAAFTVE